MTLIAPRKHARCIVCHQRTTDRRPLNGREQLVACHGHDRAELVRVQMQQRKPKDGPVIIIKPTDRVQSP